MGIFFCKNIVRTSIYIIAFLLSVLVLVSCSKLQSGVNSFSEKVKETFHIRKKTTVTASHLNLRKEPSTQSRVLGVLRKGDELEVQRLSGKWANVKTPDDREGWVYVRYITGFEELFAEKQHTTETQKSISKSKTQQAMPPREAAVEQEAVSGDKTDRFTKETQEPDGSTLKKSPSLPAERSGVNTPSDDLDTSGQPDLAAEIETAKISTSPVYESSENVKGKTTSIQGGESPIREDGEFLFSHPEGLFSLKLPTGWDNNKDNQNYFEKYIFKDPSQEIEICVIHTSSEDYSEDEFYRDLASLLMERSGARTETSPSTLRKTESGLEWLYGRIEINSEPLIIHEYWIKEHGGRLWAVVEVYPQTVSETASKRLSEIRHSFSFGTEPDPNQ